jgi:hypothetical protein
MRSPGKGRKQGDFGAGHACCILCLARAEQFRQDRCWGPACRACVTEGALGLHEPVGHAGMCCQASYMPCSHYRSASRSKAAWWAVANLTSIQRSDRAPDEVRFGFADAVLSIGSQRTTQVKHDFNAKVPQVVAPEPPPR